MKPRPQGYPGTPASNDDPASHTHALAQLGIDDFDALFSAMDLPLGTLDAQMRVQWCNAKYAGLMNRRIDEVVGRSLVEIHGAEAVESVWAPLREALSGKRTHYDRRALWADGSTQWVRVRLAPIYNAQGQVTCALGSMTSIDDVVAAREEASASRASLQKLLSAIDLPIGRWSRGGVLEDCNEHCVQWAGRPRSELIGQTVETLYGVDAWALAKPAFELAFNGQKTTYDRHVRHQERSHWKRITVFPDNDPGQSINSVYTIDFDIDAEKRAIEDLRESQRRLDMFTENIPNSLTYFDKDYVYRFASKAFLRRFDISGRDIIGLKVWEARGQTLWEEYRVKAERAMAGEEIVFERLVAEEDGTRRWKRIQFTPDFSEDGTVKGVYATQADIHDIKLAAAALKREADWDALTQTFNRNYFNAALATSLAQADTASFALLYLDLDGFKQVNDTMGHTAGDELLAHIAEQLKTALRSEDTLARIGGDEFAVLSFRGKSDTLATLAELAERLLRAASRPFRLGDITLPLTMSIGVVVVDSSAHLDVRRLLQKADSAMYEAKNAGKNRWVQAR